MQEGPRAAEIGLPCLRVTADAIAIAIANASSRAWFKLFKRNQSRKGRGSRIDAERNPPVQTSNTNETDY